jgi:H+/Cl- antiporter ClcA
MPATRRPARAIRATRFRRTTEGRRRRLYDGRRWLARALVLASAALAGLSVVAFKRWCDLSRQGFAAVRAAHPLAPLVWTTACAALIAWATRRFAPGSAGSGIPQVMAALELAVQIAAGVMQQARRWLPAHPGISPHGLPVAGGAAGIAAAFNAPLAGVMFAIEELASRLEQRSSGLIIAAIVLAGLMGVSWFGNATYFGVIVVPPLRAAMIGPALLVVAAAGALGGLFARLLHASLALRSTPLTRWRARHPVAFAAACGLAVGAIGCASQGAGFGSGYGYTRALVQGHENVPLLYVTLRWVATWLSVWSGVPGGIFAPSLAIGAGLGRDVASFMGAGDGSPVLIALGMAGFLAAVTQAPLTSFIIVMEMVDGHAMVLSLMAAALGASLVSRWISRPLYASLAAALLAPAQDASARAEEDETKTADAAGASTRT